MGPLLKGDFQANSAYIIKVFLDLVDILYSDVYIYQSMKIGTSQVSSIQVEIDSLVNIEIWSVFYQLELLAAKNLIGANLNGTSDPYAIITCGTEKRFRLFDLFYALIILEWLAAYHKMLKL